MAAFRRDSHFQPIGQRLLASAEASAGPVAGLRGFANAKASSAGQLSALTAYRARAAGKVATANLQFSFLNLLSAPRVSVGVN
jgi:hypothetical protein